jgi:hypothetical protein
MSTSRPRRTVQLPIEELGELMISISYRALQLEGLMGPNKDAGLAWSATTTSSVNVSNRHFPSISKDAAVMAGFSSRTNLLAI